MNEGLYRAALECELVGLSVVPVDWASKGPALPTWKRLQTVRATSFEIRNWFKSLHLQAFGVVCGRISGGLLVMDFDNPVFYGRWLGDLREGFDVDRLVVQKTGGGGYQVWLRCESPGRSAKLVWGVLQAGQMEIAIETKGEGGYVVTAPSKHPSGSSYAWVRGGPTEIPKLSMGEVGLLLEVARDLNEVRKPEPVVSQGVADPHRGSVSISERKPGGNVIDAFNAAYSIETLLQRYGYEARGAGRWARPGGASDSVSVKSGRSYHHSSNDPLADDHWHPAFDLYMVYEHQGDRRAAVRAAAKELGLRFSIPPPGDGEIPRGSP